MKIHEHTSATSTHKKIRGIQALQALQSHTRKYEAYKPYKPYKPTQENTRHPRPTSTHKKILGPTSHLFSEKFHASRVGIAFEDRACKHLKSMETGQALY
jgi:hypothetical protein